MGTFATTVVATLALVFSFAPRLSYVGADTPAGTFIPGESSVYSDYYGIAAPYPANNTGPIFPTANGPPGPDDLLFRNLLAAEWIVFSFYQQGVETFTAANFTDAGFKNTTYERIAQIRDNEAGHLLIFENALSNASLKPGPCKYDYNFGNDVLTYLVLQSVIEVTSMAFLSALALQAQGNATKGVLVALGEVEARHLTWALIDVWNSNPFSGPSDTVYPYVNQILDVTRQFIIPGSCPSANPEYPYPDQNLPQLTSPNAVLVPGSTLAFIYKNASHVPYFSSDSTYYAVFFHGVETISVPYDPKTNSTVIPAVFENLGIIIALIADSEGAPTEESVVAGPLFILLQPAGISLGT